MPAIIGTHADGITDWSPIDNQTFSMQILGSVSSATYDSATSTWSLSSTDAQPVTITFHVASADEVSLAVGNGPVDGVVENPYTPAGQMLRAEVSFINFEFDTTIYFEVVAHSEDGLLVNQFNYDEETGAWFNFLPSAGEPGMPRAFISVNPDHVAGTEIQASPDDPDTPVGLGLVMDAPCFAEGVMIATADGNRRVEDLAEGDIVITGGGVPRPIKWIGRTTVRLARHPRPFDVAPVRIKADAFAPGLPTRDLRLSPGHAVYVDGVLIPAACLINGATIVQDMVESVRYFHVELETHDVLLAEGLPCESYLDDGNRMSFTNAGELVTLHGRLDPRSWDDACAPMVAAGPQLDEVRRRLDARAEGLGWTKSDAADLHVVADGVEIVPLHAAGNRFWFSLPAATSFVLRSGHGVLAHTMPGLSDRRTLGVAVSEMRVNGEVLDLDGDAFADGFYPTERHDDHAWRWTNGEAALAHGTAGAAMIEVTLHMVAPSWKRRATELKLVANG